MLGSIRNTGSLWCCYLPLLALVTVMTVSPFPPSGLYCPCCGKHAVVEYKPTVYHCLNCDFEKDLSDRPHSGASEAMQMLAGAVGTLLLAMLFLL